jgi:hypothetical protein
VANASTRFGFGDWLVAEGVVTPEQLDEGIRSQSVYGGRLGTNLVEVGYLGLDELAELLTRYHGLTLAPTEWLEAPDPKAIQLVPIALIRRHKMLPLKLEREALHIAMLDPSDEDQLEFVRTAANRPVVPYVLPEIRILYWLETHLQIDRHPRFVNLAARLRRTHLVVGDAGASSLGHTFGPGLEPPESPPLEIATREEAPAVLERWFEDDILRPEPELERPATPLRERQEQQEEEEELLLEELVVESELPAPAAAVAFGPIGPARVAELEALLAGACERDQIVELVLELARAHSEAAVLFRVQGGVVRPFRASGDGIQEQLGGMEVPVGIHSLFAHPAVTGFPFRGSPPEGGIDARLLEALGRAHIQDLVVQPISIRDRVVNLLYCDNGASAFGETSVAALSALANCAARAYERLILERKKLGRA